jgi:elongation factor 1 alpha-like protein
MHTCITRTTIVHLSTLLVNNHNRGTEFQLHLSGVDVIAHCSKLIALTNTAGTDVIKAKPRCITSGASAHIQLTLARPICIEKYSDCRALGRFVLRQRGQTVAVGLVLSLIS